MRRELQTTAECWRPAAGSDTSQQYSFNWKALIEFKPIQTTAMFYSIRITMVAFFFTPRRNRSCPDSLKTVIFQSLSKKYRVLNHARFYPVLPEPKSTRVKSVD